MADRDNYLIAATDDLKAADGCLIARWVGVFEAI